MHKINRSFFFAFARAHLFDGRLTQGQVDGLTHILDYWEENHADDDDRWLAYALATAHHEVDRRMKPIKEYGGSRYFFRMYDKRGARPHVARRLGNSRAGDGALFHGRGFVQLTGRVNYTDWERRLGVDLTSGGKAADRVLGLGVATRILFEGMIKGTFTGKKLGDYFRNVREDWAGARRIINGSDKKALIAGYGRAYYAALSYMKA